MKQDDFVAYVSILVEQHFPKGVATERGEAMVLVADIARLLMEKGLLHDAAK